MPVQRIRFHKYNLPKLLTAIRLILDKEKPALVHTAVEVCYKGIMPDHLVRDMSDALACMHKEELELVAQMIENKTYEEEVKNMKCDICGEEIVGAARRTGSKFFHVLCSPTTKEKEDLHMKKVAEKKAAKAAKKSEKKVAKQTTKKAEKKTETTKKQAPAKKTEEKKEKKVTISSIVEKYKDKEYEFVEKKVKEVYPDSKFNKKHFAWYQAQFRNNK